MDNEAAVTEEQKKTNDVDIPSHIEEAYDRNTDISLEDVRVGDGVQFNTDEALEREADLIGWTPLPEGKSDIELPSE